MKNLKIDLQIATKRKDIPSRYLFNKWLNAALGVIPVGAGIQISAFAKMTQKCKNFFVTIRIVDTKEIQTLNKQFRHKNKTTNVLSFPFESPVKLDPVLLGDIVICAPVVEREAAEYGRDLKFHYAHLCVHGLLHLLGFDHQNEKDRLQMEKLETEILQKLKFPRPYD
jgi:probable rRNA maturation factor